MFNHEIVLFFMRCERQPSAPSLHNHGQMCVACVLFLANELIFSFIKPYMPRGKESMIPPLKGRLRESEDARCGDRSLSGTLITFSGPKRDWPPPALPAVSGFSKRLALPEWQQLTLASQPPSFRREGSPALPAAEQRAPSPSSPRFRSQQAMNDS